MLALVATKLRAINHQASILKSSDHNLFKPNNCVKKFTE